MYIERGMYVSVYYTNFRPNIFPSFIFNDSYVRDVHTRVCRYLLKKSVTFSDLCRSWNDSLMDILTDNLKSCMRRDRDGEPI